MHLNAIIPPNPIEEMEKNLQEARESFAKKLGEVLAFARVGRETFERTSETLSSVWDKKDLDNAIKVNQEHIDELEDIAESLEMGDLMSDKAKATARKLKKMRSTYIKDEWDEPHEVLEWLGFFQGGAIVHWELIKGFLDKQSGADLSGLADDALKFHRDIFEGVAKSIKGDYK